MASLPVTIFKFAMSPYENWQKLAWAGVFLITLGVLALNILARVLFTQQALTLTEHRHGRHMSNTAASPRRPRSRSRI